VARRTLAAHEMRAPTEADALANYCLLETSSVSVCNCSIAAFR
jgi:hypothetical protein